MINKVILIGNLGRDPEMRYTNSGTPVCNFSLATSEKYKDGSGELQERTEWHNIVLWSRQAEVANQYLRKGSQIYVEGRLQTRDYTDRDGNKRYMTEVVGIIMKMLGGRGGGEAPSGAPPREERMGGESSDDMESGISDDDIPF